MDDTVQTQILDELKQLNSRLDSVDQRFDSVNQKLRQLDQAGRKLGVLSEQTDEKINQVIETFAQRCVKITNKMKNSKTTNSASAHSK
jgi:uncharacterized protein YoxC